MGFIQRQWENIFVNGLKTKYTVNSTKGVSVLCVINKLSHPFLHLQQNLFNNPANTMAPLPPCPSKQPPQSPTY